MDNDTKTPYLTDPEAIAKALEEVDEEHPAGCRFRHFRMKGLLPARVTVEAWRSGHDKNAATLTLWVNPAPTRLGFKEGDVRVAEVGGDDAWCKETLPGLLDFANILNVNTLTPQGDGMWMDTLTTLRNGGDSIHLALLVRFNQ